MTGHVRSWRAGVTGRSVLAVLATALVVLVVQRHRGGFAAVAAAACGVAVVAAVVDRRERRIPNAVVLAGLAVLVAGVPLVAVVDHRAAGRVAVAALVGMACYAGPLLVLHLASPGGIGFGDVKLGLVLGGALGVGHPVLGALGLLAACLVAIGRRALVRRWRGGEPFAPAMALGAVLTIAVSGPLVSALGFGW